MSPSPQAATLETDIMAPSTTVTHAPGRTPGQWAMWVFVLGDMFIFGGLSWYFAVGPGQPRGLDPVGAGEFDRLQDERQVRIAERTGSRFRSREDAVDAGGSRRGRDRIELLRRRRGALLPDLSHRRTGRQHQADNNSGEPNYPSAR